MKRWIYTLGIIVGLFSAKPSTAQTTIEGEGYVCRVESLHLKDDSYDVQFKSLNNERIKNGSFSLSMDKTTTIENLEVNTGTVSYTMTNDVIIDRSKVGEIAVHDPKQYCILILKKNHHNGDIYLIDMVWYYKKAAPTFFIFEEEQLAE